MAFRFHHVARALLIGLLLLSSTLAAEEVSLGQGVMQYHWQVDEANSSAEQLTLDLPLQHTTVRAEVSGFLARVTVQQHFSNPTGKRIEAIYTFPLPENAAVHESAFRIGDRLVVAEIKEREQAKTEYRKARDAGQKASLLEQERPNIFTQSVANIGPGEQIVVALQYVQELAYDDEAYTFSFPMTVGPRYIPGSPTGHQGSGSSPDTTLVPDASRISPPTLPPALRSGHDIELELHLRAGFAIAEISSPSHEVVLDWQGSDEVTLSLTAQDRIPNKDLVVHYRTAGKGIETALLTHRTGDDGYFLLMVQPPPEVSASEAVPKELVFVLDCSGSMHGTPMQTSKALMKRFIAGMNPADSFQVIRFSDVASALAARPLVNSLESRQRGLAYVAQLQGQGGTQMIEGIKAALDLPPDPERQRMVFFLTDGYIGNEQQILAAIRERVADTRIYALGVGSSPNRYLIDEMAREGHGFAQYQGNNQDPAPVVDLFYRRLDRPVLTAVETDWGELQVIDPLPATIPDLFDRQPVFLIGRYQQPGSSVVTLRGRRGHSWTEIPVRVELPAVAPENPALPLLWARRSIAALMRQQVRGELPEIRRQVLELALRYGLMSKYTAFVAVERTLKPGLDLPLETILIPSELPAGMSYEGAFGPPVLSHSRIKPGDPVLTVRAPEQAIAVMASFPFGLQRLLSKEQESGHWTCRFLVPRDQPEGRYRINIRIVLPEGDWIDTSAEYVIDATPPAFTVTAELRGRTLHLRAVPKNGALAAVAPDEPGKDEPGKEYGIVAAVLPDLQSVVVRPPQGGYVVLEQRADPDAIGGRSWQAEYELPAWYDAGTYTFRFLAIDTARNTFSDNLVVRVPLQVAAMEQAR